MAGQDPKESLQAEANKVVGLEALLRDDPQNQVLREKLYSEVAAIDKKSADEQREIYKLIDQKRKESGLLLPTLTIEDKSKQDNSGDNGAATQNGNNNATTSDNAAKPKKNWLPEDEQALQDWRDKNTAEAIKIAERMDENQRKLREETRDEKEQQRKADLEKERLELDKKKQNDDSLRNRSQQGQGQQQPQQQQPVQQPTPGVPAMP